MSGIEKRIQFSTEQKSMIWKVCVEPEGGTGEEAKYFVEVCEMYGLNPLLKEIVFQRKEKKMNSGVYKVSYITTRDGYLKVARQDPNFVGAPLSAVVKEGDEFWLDPVNGIPHHRFGTQRGQILGAWAVIKHKVWDPVSVFVDFKEYQEANANSTTWTKNPSPMIQKIGEVFVMRRQFPLSGLYTAEEFGMDSVIEDSSNSSAIIGDKLPDRPRYETVTIQGNSGGTRTNKPTEIAHTNDQTVATVPDNIERQKQTQQPQAGMDKAVAPSSVEGAATTSSQQSEVHVTDAAVQIQPMKFTPAESTTTPNIVESGAGEKYILVEKVDTVHPRNRETYYKLTLTHVASGATVKAAAREQSVVEYLKDVSTNTTLQLVLQDENGFMMVKKVAA